MLFSLSRFILIMRTSFTCETNVRKAFGILWENKFAWKDIAEANYGARGSGSSCCSGQYRDHRQWGLDGYVTNA